MFDAGRSSTREPILRRAYERAGDPRLHSEQGLYLFAAILWRLEPPPSVVNRKAGKYGKGRHSFPPFPLFLFNGFDQIAAVGASPSRLRGFRVSQGLEAFSAKSPVCDQQTPPTATGGDKPKGVLQRFARWRIPSAVHPRLSPTLFVSCPSCLSWAPFGSCHCVREKWIHCRKQEGREGRKVEY